MEIDHKNYPKKLKTLSDEALRFIIEDATEALRIYPTNPKAGYYQDETHYAYMELNRRSEDARCSRKNYH